MFKLLQTLLLLREEKEPGTYAAVSFDDATKEAILNFIAANDIPNGVPAEKLHSTVLYSRVNLDQVEPLGELDPVWIGLPKQFEVWGDEKKCLVLVFDCLDMEERHEFFMEQGGTHDFDDYTPHVTFSYDVGDLDISSLPSFNDDLIITSEYMEPLELDWK